jgi:hypothetical protein
MMSGMIWGDEWLRIHPKQNISEHDYVTLVLQFSTTTLNMMDLTLVYYIDLQQANILIVTFQKSTYRLFLIFVWLCVVDAYVLASNCCIIPHTEVVLFRAWDVLIKTILRTLASHSVAVV